MNYELLTSLVYAWLNDLSETKEDLLHCGKLAKMLFDFCYPPLNNRIVPLTTTTYQETWT